MAENKNVNRPEEVIDIPQEQVKYANLLLYGSWAAIILLVISYFFYLTGIIEPYIAPAKMPEYWSMSSSEFLHTIGVSTGWGWAKLLNYSDFLNYIGIVLLGALTIIGYIGLLLMSYIRQKDTAYTFIVVAEIMVLLLAASGILGAGGH